MAVYLTLPEASLVTVVVPSVTVMVQAAESVVTVAFEASPPEDVKAE